MQMVDLPDRKGHFGLYGGIFVAETLMYALDELRDNYERLRNDPAFVAELKHFAGKGPEETPALFISGLPETA